MHICSPGNFCCVKWPEIYLLFKASRPALGPTQPHIQYVAGLCSLVKGLKYEAKQSLLSCALVTCIHGSHGDDCVY